MRARAEDRQKLYGHEEMKLELITCLRHVGGNSNDNESVPREGREMRGNNTWDEQGVDLEAGDGGHRRKDRDANSPLVLQWRHSETLPRFRSVRAEPVANVVEYYAVPSSQQDRRSDVGPGPAFGTSLSAIARTEKLALLLLFDKFTHTHVERG